MCLNSGGNDNGQFFSKIFWRGKNDKRGKMTKGKNDKGENDKGENDKGENDKGGNDRGYYGNS